MTYLTPKDIQMLNSSINIMNNVYNDLRALPVKDAATHSDDMPPEVRELYNRKDGKDTRLFDIVAEQTISLGNSGFGHWSAFARAYNVPGVIVTEERGRIGEDITSATPVIISDPVDKSSYLEKIIKKHGKKCTDMGEVFDCERELIGETKTRTEACNSSVTLLFDNMIKYSLMLNLFSGEMFVAYEKGVYTCDINTIKDEGDLTSKVAFKEKESLNMLCYTKPGKYQENRIGTHLRFFYLNPDIKSPGGPNRFTYLLNEDDSGVNVIAHNGEKIQESLPDIAVAFFSNNELQAYKLFCDRKYNNHRAGKGLTPNLENSIYGNGLLINTGIKLSFLGNREYPSQFRDTTVIVPSKNESAITMMQGMVQREFATRII